MLIGKAAAQSPFRGLIASGWHTCAMMMRMVADFSMSKDSVMGSPGVDNSMAETVRPGDRLCIRQTVVSTERSKSKPDRGVVKTRTEVLNQDKEIVMHATGMIISVVDQPDRIHSRKQIDTATTFRFA